MKSLPTVAWVLLGLILIAAGLLSLDRSEAETFPSASSYSPSGASAFARIARDAGYNISLNFTDNPELKKDDVVVAFRINRQFNIYSQDENLDRQRLTDIVMTHVKEGGNAILFDVSDNFGESSKRAEVTVGSTRNMVGPATAPLKINSDSQPQISGTSGQVVDPFETESEPADDKSEAIEGDMMTVAAGSFNDSIATALFQNKGTLLEVEDGLIASNRFVDQNDNAKETMALLGMVARPGAHLVFTEAVFGNVSNPSVLEMIGNWAIAAWWQILLLFGVIVYTLGKPFGYPDEARPVQRGARDLVEAIATTYRRAKATHISLQWIHDSADREIRRKLKLPSDTHELERNRLIPGDLAMALARVKMASVTKTPPWEAARMAADLDDKMLAFMGKAARRRKRKKFR